MTGEPLIRWLLSKDSNNRWMEEMEKLYTIQKMLSKLLQMKFLMRLCIEFYGLQLILEHLMQLQIKQAQSKPT